MKKKTKAITPKTGRRGRKPGDGVLKEIDPQDIAGTLRKLFAGRIADDPVANVVGWGRHLAYLLEYDYKEQEAAMKPVKEVWRQKLQKHNAKFAAEAVAALAAGNADWFGRVARAIVEERIISQAPLFPLHLAVLGLGNTPLLIGSVCERLEQQGLRPQGQSDESWQRRVRTVCKEVGFTLLPDKPGPKRKRS